MTFRNPLARMAILAAGAFAAPLLHAQITATAAPVLGSADNERFDLSGSAAYGHFNPGYAHQVQATNLIGWQGSFTTWFTRRVGVEATGRGLYGNYQIPLNSANVAAVSSSMSEHLFLVGPSVRLYSSPRYTAGGHLLVGGAYGSFDSGFSGTGVQPFQVGVYNNELAFAYAIGGWGDYKLNSTWAVRLTADYQPTHYGSLNQNEPFVAVGVVYKWGQRK